MDKMTRVISILIDLINYNVIDAKYLANKYEVSTRTIYRDIALLEYSGIPIVSTQGNQGGFSIIEGFKIDKNVLTEDEFSIILRGLQVLISQKDKEAMKVFDKLMSILQSNKKEKILKESNHVMIDISPMEKRKNVEETYQMIHEAIKEKKCMEITYYTANKGSQKREIEPHTLLFKSTDWYLYAYCKLRKSFRMFKLTRIKDPKILEETFEEREIEEYEELSFDQNLNSADITLKVEEKFSHMIEEYHHVIKKEQKGKEIFLTLSYPLNEWVYSTILSFGEHVEVIEPREVKEEIKKMIDKMSQKYK